MDGIREFLKVMFQTAKEALRQMELAVPDYWDETIAVIARAALLAMALFAAVLLVQLILLLCARKKNLRKIAAFAATLMAVLILYLCAAKPLSETAGERSLAWGAPGDSAAASDSGAANPDPQAAAPGSEAMSPASQAAP